MKIINTSIPEVIVFIPQIFSDKRGHFLETYQEKKYHDAGIPKPFVQDNQSYSFKNVLLLNKGLKKLELIIKMVKVRLFQSCCMTQS